MKTLRRNTRDWRRPSQRDPSHLSTLHAPSSLMLSSPCSLPLLSLLVPIPLFLHSLLCFPCSSFAICSSNFRRTTIISPNSTTYHTIMRFVTRSDGLQHTHNTKRVTKTHTRNLPKHHTCIPRTQQHTTYISTYISRKWQPHTKKTDV